MRASFVASRTPRLLAAVALVALTVGDSRADQQPLKTLPAVEERPTTTGVYLNRHIWRAVRPDGAAPPQQFMAHGYHIAGGGNVFHSTFNDPAA